MKTGQIVPRPRDERESLIEESVNIITVIDLKECER
jgi:hypothetical protein